MKLNRKAVATQATAEGAYSPKISPEQQLSRSVMSCMLWEDTFYEDGQSIGQRIASLVAKVSPEYAAATARTARSQMKLRHVPLLIVREMARLPGHKALVKNLLADVIQRPDEITEFMSIYWAEGKQPLSAQIKKGLALAFRRFNEYSLAKYNRDSVVKLRDALFLSHSKPQDAPGDKYTKAERKAQVARDLTKDEQLYLKLVNGSLATPETWEVKLSAGENKKDTFVELMAKKNLGALAFIRNLRNIQQSGIDKQTVKDFSEGLNLERVLPFRFIAAARHVPIWEDIIEPMMLRCLEGQAKLPGKTKLLVDISGSMDWKLSSKSDMKRTDAAYGLAILLREICEDVEIFTFSDSIANIPPRHGFALRDAMHHSQPHGGTYLGNAVTVMNRTDYDRLIVITDEQSADNIPNPNGKGYVINVASEKNGIGYGKWNHIDGWSEAIIDFIQELERTNHEDASTRSEVLQAAS